LKLWLKLHDKMHVVPAAEASVRGVLPAGNAASLLSPAAGFGIYARKLALQILPQCLLIFVAFGAHAAHIRQPDQSFQAAVG
jgi:tyrosine-protein phosphatase YwqE